VRYICLILIAFAAHADEWWNEEWQVRHRIDINSSLINEDLAGFPVCIRIPVADAKLDRAKPDGSDARVLDAAGNVCDHENVVWGDGGIELYARVPMIKANTPGQRLYLYYGNPEANAPPVADVWEESYCAVLHLRNDVRDVSGNSAVVTAEGAVELKDFGAVFSEQPGFLNVDPASLQDIGEQITLTIRFRALESPGLQTLASGRKTDGPDEWFNFGLKTPSTVHTNATSGGKQAPELNLAGIALDEWHTAVVRYDGKTNSRALCIDGTLFERDASLPGPLNIDELRIGRGLLHFEPWQFHGTIDEVRIATDARSDSWLKAESGSMAEVQAFAPVTVAHVRGEPAPPPAQFTLLTPADGVEWRKRKPVELSWSPSAGADTYVVQLSTDAQGKNIIASTSAAGTSIFVDPGATPAENGDKNINGIYLDEASSGIGQSKDRPLYWTVVAESDAGKTSAAEIRALSFYDWDPAEIHAHPYTPKKRPVLETAQTEYEIGGYLRMRIDNAINEYLISTPVTSPAILQVLRDRDKTPLRDPLVPWAGEFAGKYLTAAQLTWRLTRDEELKSTIDQFVKDLIACQQEDGYLGPFPKSSRITGGNWDVWGHYHCMLGLMFYYEDTQYAPAWETCKKAADLLFETFGPGGPTLTNDGGGGQMNMAVCHALVLLYKQTGIARYLDLANYIVHEAWNEPGAGGYLVAALAGKPIIEFPQHRWEAIHDWQALPELYWLTGDEQYKKAFEHMWWSAVRGDRHNTGGLTSGEGFTGSPFNTGAIETCCTVAWLAMSIDMLRLTGDSQVADEIELSTFNSALGAIPHGGRSCAYNVPMNGTRLFGVELHWQAPKGGPDLNCCSVNANRPLGMISQWALMQKDGGLAVNFFGLSTMKTKLKSGNKVQIQQITDYPRNSKVVMKLTLDKPETFPIYIRIPKWSERFGAIVNDGPGNHMYNPGTYTGITREWKSGDRIELQFDFRPHFWAGAESFANTVSFYRGPILYAYDARYNDFNPGELPKFDPETVTFAIEPINDPAIRPWILGSLTAADGSAVRVVDLSSAGQTGNHYVTWLPATAPPTRELLIK